MTGRRWLVPVALFTVWVVLGLFLMQPWATTPIGEVPPVKCERQAP